MSEQEYAHLTRCEGCAGIFSVARFGTINGFPEVMPTFYRQPKDYDKGLCPRCALEWFKRLARGERAEWVTRGKR